jgi:ABC-type xylose transport system permease subunit
LSSTSLRGASLIVQADPNNAAPVRVGNIAGLDGLITATTGGTLINPGVGPVTFPFIGAPGPYDLALIGMVITAVGDKVNWNLMRP